MMRSLRREWPQDAKLEGHYSERALEVARATWKERMRREHHSSTVFSGLLPQLIAAAATLDIKTSVLRMAMEELAHAQLCGSVIEMLGARAEIETDLATPPLPEHPKCTAVERALRNVLFVGLNETLGIAALSEERGVVREPAIDAVLAQLLGDEVGHAKLGWIYLRELWPSFDAEQRARTNAYLPYALAYLESELIAPLAHVAYDDALRDELDALGVLAPQDLRELLYATMHAAVIAPLDAQGLDASRAWRERRS
jgi:hypothetical protein